MFHSHFSNRMPADLIRYNNTTLQLYDMSGTLKYSGNIDTSISRARVAHGMKNPLGLDLLIGSAGAMESVKLK